MGTQGLLLSNPAGALRAPRCPCHTPISHCPPPHLAAPSVPSTGGDCSDAEVKQKMALPVAGGRQRHRNALREEWMLMAIDWKALCIALNVSLVSS